MNDREIALDALMEILEKKQYSHLVIKAVLDKYSYLPKQSRSFIKRLCAGTIEQRIRLDYVLDLYSKTKTQKMKPFIRTLLRMGAYQLLFMDAVPDSAVCNESVKLAAKRGFSSLKGYVNGVLRTISREKGVIRYPDRETDFANYLRVTYSMPEWIVGNWRARFGDERAEEMMRSLLVPRPLFIRMRTQDEAETGRLLAKMREAGVEIEPAGLEESLATAKNLQLDMNNMLANANAWQVSGFDRIDSLPGYGEGLFAIQDIGSMLVVEMAGVQPGQQVLDVCAAPGGKSLHAADKLRGRGHVTARDLTQEKVALILENVSRCKQEELITAEVFDATVCDEAAIGRYDVVIADLPCSGLGVIGRKSDIKYRVTPESVRETAELQRNILENVQTYVKPGGTLMFSTCTLTEEENEKSRDWFLSRFPFVLEKETLLLPGVHGSDGFYMAKFVREK